MVTVLLTLVIIGVSIILLSIGTIISRKQLNASCSSIGDDCFCISDKHNKCEKKQQFA